MAGSDQLHQLIQSLTRSEKRYFRLYANSGEQREPAYLELFDLMSAQTDYDEKKILEKLKHQNTARNLSAAKNYLFELILRCLSEYNQAKTVDFRINSYIQYSRLLQGKGQYKAAVKYLKKAENVAKAHEKFTRILEIKEVEKYMVTDMLAALVYYPLARLALHIERLGIAVENFPLSHYGSHSFYTMRNSSRDRLDTQLEQRFTRTQIQQMMYQAGVESIHFSENTPFWRALGTKAQT